jgi:hypothetical protein
LIITVIEQLVSILQLLGQASASLIFRPVEKNQLIELAAFGGGHATGVEK